MENLYCHSASVAGLPRVTVAGIVKDGILRIGYSRCSRKDVYVKKLGNLIAHGRANKRPVLTEEESKDLIPQFIGIALTIIKQKGGVPKERKAKKEERVVLDVPIDEVRAVQQHN